MDEIPEERVVWLKPTRASPACRFVLTPKAQRTVSSCLMWNAAAARGRPIEEFGSDLCSLCKTGQVAEGKLVKNK